MQMLRRTGGSSRHVARLIPLACLMASALSCSSPEQPRVGVTLLVTNATCAPGPCTTQRVFLFPSNGPITPGGLWALDLGLMTGAEMCATIPTSAKFLLIQVNENGTADTTTITWTNLRAAELGSVDTTAPFFAAMPSTSEFVAASSAGWSVTLPGGTLAASAPPCTP